LVGRAERALLKRADSVLVASTAFRRHIEASGADAERVITMANWVHISPSTGDREAVRRQHHWSKDDIIVLHSGNMGLKQDLQRVIEAAAMAGSRSPKVKFVLMGDGSQRNDLEQSALRVPNITLKDPICESDYSDLLAAADILLINERVGVTDMSMPSKVTSYLASGRPVVAAVAWEGVTAKEIVRSGGGIVTQTQTPAGILEAVLSLSNDTARATDLARCGQEYAAAELSAEASLSRLDAVLVGSWSSSAWSQLSRLEAL
jgi:glycosyltransferase involved in cell wall biosynthesis